MATDTVCVMEQGEVVQQGKPAELFEQSDGPYAQVWRSRGV